MLAREGSRVTAASEMRRRVSVYTLGFSLWWIAVDAIRRRNQSNAMCLSRVLWEGWSDAQGVRGGDYTFAAHGLAGIARSHC